MLNMQTEKHVLVISQIPFGKPYKTEALENPTLWVNRGASANSTSMNVVGSMYGVT